MNNIYEGIDKEHAELMEKFLNKTVDEAGKYVMDWQNLIIVARLSFHFHLEEVETGAGNPAQFSLDNWAKVLRLAENEVVRDLTVKWVRMKEEMFQRFLDYGVERVLASEPNLDAEDARVMAFLSYEAWKSQTKVE
jgi:hypothetical protein